MFNPFGHGLKGFIMKALLVVFLIPFFVLEQIKRIWRGY